MRYVKAWKESQKTVSYLVRSFIYAIIHDTSPADHLDPHVFQLGAEEGAAHTQNPPHCRPPTLISLLITRFIRHVFILDLLLHNSTSIRALRALLLLHLGELVVLEVVPVVGGEDVLRMVVGVMAVEIPVLEVLRRRGCNPLVSRLSFRRWNKELTGRVVATV